MECYPFQNSLLLSTYLYCTLHQAFAAPKTLGTFLCLKGDLMGFHVKIVLRHKNLVVTQSLVLLSSHYYFIVSVYICIFAIWKSKTMFILGKKKLCQVATVHRKMWKKWQFVA
jgi:hypothetical protein